MSASRKLAGLAATAVFAISAAAQPVADKEPKVVAGGETVRIQTYPGAVINLIQWILVEKGFCAAHQIRCELASLPSAPLGIQAALSGSIEIAVAGTDVAVQAAAGGAPIRIVGGLLPTPPFSLALRKDVADRSSGSPFPSNMKDVKGLKVGVAARGSSTEMQMRLLLSEAGMNPDADVTYVAVGAPAAMYTALAAKQIDAALGFEPVPTICEEGLVCKNIVDMRKGQGSKVGRAIAGATYVAAKSYIDKNPRVIDAFRQASAEAIEWAARPENFTQVAAVAAKNFTLGNLPDADGITARLLKNQVQTLKPGVDREGVKVYADYLLREKRIPREVAPASLVDPKAYR